MVHRLVLFDNYYNNKNEGSFDFSLSEEVDEMVVDELNEFLNGLKVKIKKKSIKLFLGRIMYERNF